MAKLDIKLVPTQMIVEDILPTPVARDWKGAEGRDYKRAKAGSTERHTLPGLLEIPEAGDPTAAENAGKTSRLSPLFTEEMMGFPLMWTALPFLSESGAPKPSKPTATPSSHK